jgi:hypothetical protein
MQFETNFFPVYDRFEESSQRHLFLLTAPDSTLESVDSSSKSRRLKPSLSPASLQLGVGANVDAITSENFNTKFKLGFGYSQYNNWNQTQDVTNDTGVIKPNNDTTAHLPNTAELAALLGRYNTNYKIVQRLNDKTVYSYGPEVSIDASIRLGRFATAEGEAIVLFPISPIILEHTIRPNYQVNTTVSWRISRSITLDYLYRYLFSQPLKTDIKNELSQHRIWLRFSFNSSR